MVDIYGPVDYDKIKEKIKAVIDAALKPTRTAPVQELSSQEIPAGGTAEFTVGPSETDFQFS